MKSQDKQYRSQILNTAKRIFGRIGYKEATIEQLANTAGLSKRLIQHYFHSKESLLIETQRVVFRDLHRRFTHQAIGTEKGLTTALDALDAMWHAARGLHDIAPFMLETLNLGNKDKTVKPHLARFYQESTSLLEDGIHKVFAKEIGTLVVPPNRLAILIRIFLSGMIVELAQTDSTDDLKQLDQVYSDIRSLFERFVVETEEFPLDENTDSVPLPW